MRTLESSANIINNLDRDSGWTDIFIYPSYEFKFVDAMITNFHFTRVNFDYDDQCFCWEELYIMDAYEAIKEILDF